MPLQQHHAIAIAHDPTRLATFGDDGAARVVIEVPRGSSVKYKYEPALGAIVASRGLPLGVTYPYDWGFVAGTMAADGDPLDALVLHRAATYPGVIVPCRIAAMLRLTQDDHDGRRQDNHRVLAIPAWDESYAWIDDLAAIPERMRREIERFFLSTTYFTEKNQRVEGWADRASAERFVRGSARPA